MNMSDIVRLCAEVSLFSRKNNLDLVGKPVITWEFATLSDYGAFLTELKRALGSELIFRKGEGDFSELDCYNVTFKVVCKQRMMTQKYGPFSASDIKL